MDKAVRPERSEWRDLEFSKRHRQFGWDVPATDIDFLMLEYDLAEPVALIEYKHEFAKPAEPKHPTYQSLKKLCNRAHIPFFAVRYANDFAWYRVVPLNGLARMLLPIRQEMTEKEYVEFLYQIRGRNARTNSN